FTDGGNPTGVLAIDTGNLYSTTSNGGTGCGVVFKLTPNGDDTWTFSKIHTFSQAGRNGDGCIPFGGVTQDLQGNLYGATSSGGTNISYGEVYELMPQTDGTWKEKRLYSFGEVPDAATPLGEVVLDQAGNVYGTASFGGANSAGAIFEVKP